MTRNKNKTLYAILLTTVMAMFISQVGYGQTAAQNYVRTRTPRTKISTSTKLDQLTGTKDSVATSIDYVDGLGRPLQTIQMRGSASGKDIIQPHAYDALGREPVKYLPYTYSSAVPGTFQATALADNSGNYSNSQQYVFYNTAGQGYVNTPKPFVETAFEPSPLNRPVEQGAPGSDWQLNSSGVAHTVKISYTSNNSIAWTTDSVNSRKVSLYNATINAGQNETLTAAGYYNGNKLNVTITKDENWISGRAGTIEEYKDMDGRIVLKRAYNYTTSLQLLSTYYIYDDKGQLAFVLPPAANGDGAGTISQATLDNLCYQYRYDERGRLSQKKLPGKGWEYIVYNVLDQPVATQDSLQRAANQWLFTKYDGLGRPVLSGIYSNGAISRTSLQATLTAIATNLYETPTGTGTGYTNVAWPTANITATLTSTFYDSYANIPSLPATYNVTTGVSAMTKGETIATKTAVLNTPTDQLWDVLYYDDLGQTIKTYSQHYLGGTANSNNYDLTTVSYNFSNQPTLTTRKHFTTSSTNTPLVTIANTYMYDHMGRKLKTWEQITNGTTPTTKTLISKVDYNELDQVLNKRLHSTDSTTFLQSIAYTYNERGWLLTSIAPLFDLQLMYNTGSTKAYNGNIMYQFWGANNVLNNHYTYTYDQLNRLKTGVATTGNNESISYDLMGNITALNRYQTSTIIDQLGYTYYSGTNQLQSVIDVTSSIVGLVPGTTNYLYDGNGNLLSSTNTGNITQNKSFTYNLLNLPKVVTTANGTVTYIYDATGKKLRKVAIINGTTVATDYIDGIQYKNNGGTIDFIQTEEGKTVPVSGGYDYYYYLADNLGNTRVTFDSMSGATPLQTDDYYSFGMEISSGTVPSPKNEYLYNKKELQEELSQYDYGARFYDPVIARWNVVDKMAEHPDQIDKSPYAYVVNNPIRYDDPDGNCPICVIVIYYAVEEGIAYFATAAVVSTVVVHRATSVRNSSYQSNSDEPSPQTKPKGSNNPNTKKAAETGQEAHRQEQKKLRDEGAKTEVPMQLPDGTNVRKDAVKPDGTAVIIKPNTPSGRKSAAKREQLMKKNGVKTETKLYNSNDKKYQPGSPSYIGPNK